MKKVILGNAVVLIICAAVSHGGPVSLTGKTPEQVYNIYLQAVRTADADTILACSATAAAGQMPSKQEMKAALAMMQKMAPSNVKVIKKELSGNKATLTLEGVTPNPFTNTKDPGIGTIKLSKEGGVWKIAGENWEIKGSGSSTNALPAGMDAMMGQFVNAFSNAFTEGMNPEPVEKPGKTAPSHSLSRPRTYVDETRGFAGNPVESNNVYKFNVETVGQKATLRFWASGDIGTMTSGKVSVTPPGNEEGTVVYTWQPKDFKVTANSVTSYAKLKPITCDISRLVKAPGPYAVAFKWTTGDVGLSILRVELQIK